MINQSAVITFTALIVGTTSPFLNDHIDKSNLLPLAQYSYQYEPRQKADTYLLEHEVMSEIIEDVVIEQLIEIPIVKTITAKFGKPTPLEFTCVEDENGFLV